MDMLFKQQRRVLKLVIAPTLDVPRERTWGGRGVDEGRARGRRPRTKAKCGEGKQMWGGATVEILGYNVSTT